MVSKRSPSSVMSCWYSDADMRQRLPYWAGSFKCVESWTGGLDAPVGAPTSPTTCRIARRRCALDDAAGKADGGGDGAARRSARGRASFLALRLGRRSVAADGDGLTRSAGRHASAEVGPLNARVGQERVAGTREHHPSGLEHVPAVAQLHRLHESLLDHKMVSRRWRRMGAIVSKICSTYRRWIQVAQDYSTPKRGARRGGGLRSS